MKKAVLLVMTCVYGLMSSAQNDIDVLLSAGVEDAQRFANDYLAPGTNGLMHSMNTNWFNSAKVKPFGGFEISVAANAGTETLANASASIDFFNFICFTYV